MQKPDLWGVETEAQQLAALMARALPVTVASVALRDEPSLSLAIKAVNSARPVDQFLPVGARVPLSAAPWHRRAFERGEAVLVERNGNVNFQREAELALIPNLNAMCLVPIRFAEDTVGVLALGEMRASARAPFSAEKQQRCRAILEEFVGATGHAWEARRLRRQVRVMSSFVQLARGVSSARSFQDLLESLTSETADWLGTPVHGALLRLSSDDVRLLASWQLPEGALEDGGRQLILAMTRAAGPESWPVSVTSVAEDLLDPVGAADPKARAWTRIALPLMRQERLIGVACLYVEDELGLVDWEREALRRRGELMTLGVQALEVARAHEAEGEWLHRVVLELLNGYRRALLQETFSGLNRVLVGRLPERLRDSVPSLALRAAASPPEGESADVVAAVAAVIAEISAAVVQLWEGDDRPEPQKIALDVNDVVVHAVRIARMSLDALARHRGVAVEVKFQPAEGSLPINGSLMLVGAMVHAIESVAEAMPDGGEIHVRTGREDGHVVIAMEEYGREPLVDALAQERFSLNHPGLLVSVLRAIAHNHGGRVTLVPHEARGNTLLLHLPAGREGERI